MAGGLATLEFVSRHSTGIYAGSAAEIVAHDPRSQRLFVTNASTVGIDILQLSATGSLTVAGFIPTPAIPSHVRIWDDGVTSTVVVAVPNANGLNPGSVRLYSTSGVALGSVLVGARPDMVYITSSGLALTADEGQPVGGSNPVGSVSIVDLTTLAVSTVSLSVFDGQEAALRANGVRIFPGLSASVDLEPEYIAVSPDQSTAWVVCQEQNAVIWVDIATATATQITPLGTKDHSLPGQGLDGSDRDNTINIANWPVHGMRMPDSTVACQLAGQVYLVTANEGDARNESARCSSRTLDPVAFPGAGGLQQLGQLGRLFVSTIDGDLDGDGDHDQLFCYGARSFSIFNMSTGGNLVYDSGDDFESVIAQVEPADFNSNHDENGTFDRRSDNSGPEPEALIVGTIGAQTFAFIGMERQGGIFVYDITNPQAVQFHQYFNARNFAGVAEDGTAGDLAVEGLIFIEAAVSPNGESLLVAANEISGTTTVFRIVVSGGLVDCNTNGIDDAQDIATGTSGDCNADGIPDDCQLAAADCNSNGIPDSCELDTDLDGVIDTCDPCPLDVFDDSDGDGSCDSDDLCPGQDDTLDADVDGIPDGCDSDDDNDTWSDSAEIACGTDPLSALSVPTDTDTDGICNTIDLDDDNDTWSDGAEAACGTDPLSAASIPTDTDSDGTCDLLDLDDDNDTWVDGAEIACGSDPLDGQSVPSDQDNDQICDVVDPDDDNDGVLDSADSAPLDPFSCTDDDGDGCDDCAVAGSAAPANDGLDSDRDGLCDVGDPDDDNDGVLDSADSAPLDPFSCSDGDGDGCDDCAVAGSAAPANDGLDSDRDGLCDVGDPDDDNDGVLDSADNAPLDPFSCTDSDGDGCDDCSVTGSSSPNDDGLDTDSDGLCDSGDADDDNDGVGDLEDLDPQNPFVCRDLDLDGCDDCSSGVDNPLDDGTDTDLDGVCDLSDICPGFDDAIDTDSDGEPDGCDLCPLDSQNDVDMDGICGDVDRCPIDPLNDSDSDGSCDSDDLCPGFDDSIDCDGNGVPDGCDILAGASDCDGNGVLDSCETDCDGNGVADVCEGLSGTITDCDGNGVPDSCDLAAGEPDQNLDGIPDSCQGSAYRRGDGNQDGSIDISDPIETIDLLFGTGTTTCLAAHDTNADGAVDLADAIALLDYIFTGTSVPAEPFTSCGLGASVQLDCGLYSLCP